MSQNRAAVHLQRSASVHPCGGGNQLKRATPAREALQFSKAKRREVPTRARSVKTTLSLAIAGLRGCNPSGAVPSFRNTLVADRAREYDVDHSRCQTLAKASMAASRVAS